MLHTVALRHRRPQWQQAGQQAGQRAGQRAGRRARGDVRSERPQQDRAGVSHDLSNLLAVVLINLELASATCGPAGQDAMQQAAQAARSAALLSRQLHKGARPQRRRPPTSVALAPLVASAVGYVEATVGHGATLRADVPICLRALGDAQRLERVFFNIALNARDAIVDGGFEAGMITVRGELVQQAPDAVALPPRADGYALIEVTDTGCGMDASTAARLFEPEFTTKGEQGSGLGGAVVAAVVQEHRGLVEVETAPGRGTTVRVYLPAAPHDELDGPLPFA